MQQQSGNLPGLPAPAQLAGFEHEQAFGPRAISYSEIDLAKAGWLYEHNMPSQRVSDSAQPLADFSPDFDSSAPQLSGLAYAIYRFDAEDYDRLPQLRLAWDNAPAREDVWVALSDWQKDRWLWFRPDNNWRVNFGSSAAYMKDGRLLLAAVVVGGSDPASLASLRLGPLPPVPALSASPQSGSPPLLVSFDASGSMPGEGSIAKYEWDFEGDGTYDLDSGSDPTVEHEYAQGSYTARLRVTNTLSVSATVPSPPIRAETGWQHTFGRGNSDYLQRVIVDAEGNIYACGSSDDTDGENTLSCLSLLKLNQQGELQWARGWRSSGNAYGIDLAMEPGGGVACGGTYQPDGQEVRSIVQHWSAGGVLLSSHEYSRENPLNIDNLFSINGSVAISGQTTSDGNYDVFCALLEADGELIWSRVEGTSQSDYSHCTVLLASSFTPPFGIAVGGSDSTSPQVVTFELQSQSASVRELELSLEADEEAYMQGLIYHDDGFNPPVYYCSGGIIITLEERNSFILQMPQSGASMAGTRFNGPIQAYDLSSDGQGGLLVCGNTWDGTHRGWLGRFELPNLELSDCFSFAASDNVVLRRCLPVEDGLLVAGDAPNANVIRSFGTKQSSALSANWVDTESTGIDNDISMQPNSGTVFDLMPLLTIDSGAGHHDMYLSKLQLEAD